MVMLSANEQGKRCGHNFLPEECPYEQCGYREALKEVQVATLAGELAISCCHAAARGKQQELKFADRPLGEAVECIRNLRRQVDQYSKQAHDLDCELAAMRMLKAAVERYVQAVRQMIAPFAAEGPAGANAGGRLQSRSEQHDAAYRDLLEAAGIPPVRREDLK